MDGYPQVLLIDDDTQVREALGEALAAEDYRVSLAASGYEALCRVQEPGQVDAVLLDLMLGEENGWTLFEQLTSLVPSVPVILITAARGQRPPSRSGVALMEKPLNLSLLFEILREFTAQPEPSARARTAVQELIPGTAIGWLTGGNRENGEERSHLKRSHRRTPQVNQTELTESGAECASNF